MKATQTQTDHIIKIPINDWVEEFNTIEADVKNEDDLIKGRMQGYSPQQMGRLAITARELGLAPDDILPPNKAMLNSGSAISIAQMIASRHKAIELENGQTVTVREFVGSVREEEEDQQADETHSADVESDAPDQSPDDLRLVAYNDPEAKERAVRYLFKNVMPNIRERFKIIAANDPAEIKPIIKELKKLIDVAAADLV